MVSSLTRFALSPISSPTPSQPHSLVRAHHAPIALPCSLTASLAGYNLPGAMDKVERLQFEDLMHDAFEVLIAVIDDVGAPVYGGQVHSLSPKLSAGRLNPFLMDAEKYEELLGTHAMFGDLRGNPCLTSAGIASDWPYGRGCWQSDDKQCMIWYGEEDQLRIMCMRKWSKLNAVFDRLKAILDVLESVDGIDFVTSDRYGYLTSSPANLGTAMRASVHIHVPHLTADGSDAKAKEAIGSLNLSVRGTGDGAVDISPRARMCITERDIVEMLWQGVQLLADQESLAAEDAEAGGEKKA